MPEREIRSRARRGAPFQAGTARYFRRQAASRLDAALFDPLRVRGLPDRAQGRPPPAIGDSAMKIIRTLAVIALTALGNNSAFAENYPVKPIKIIVSTSPAGITDILARMLGQYITA